MIYGGSTPYGGSVPYGGIGAGVSPNAIVDLSSLGSAGRLIIALSTLLPNVNGVTVDLDDLGDDGRLIIYFNGECAGAGVADAGELWRRVPRT